MPFALLIIGTALVIAGVRNTVYDYKGKDGEMHPGLFTLAKNDFTGNNNYIYWMLSILVIGSLGYIDSIKPLSRAFLVLVIIVLFLKNGKDGGFFERFNKDVFGISNSGEK
jgi:hypothetical protein